MSTHIYKHHYTYLLTDLSPSSTQRYYIGVKSCTEDPELNEYYGSSIHLPDKDYEKVVIQEFETRKLALQHEIKLHKEYNVKCNDLFYNRANQTSTGFDTTGTSVPKTKEHIDNMLKTRNKEYKLPNGEVTTSYKETGKLVSLSKNKIVYEDGVSLTYGKQASIKSAKTMSVLYDNNGDLTSIKEQRIHKMKNTKVEQGRFFNVVNISGDILFENIPSVKMKLISAALIRKSKNHYLGKSPQAKGKLIKSGKAWLIGSYSIEIMDKKL